MNILFVSGETPLFPAGGISTYLNYIVPALRERGHSVFLFTFRKRDGFTPPSSTTPFDSDNVHIEQIADDTIHTLYPSSSHFQSTSFYLAQRLEKLIEQWKIDIVEAADFQAPCLALFQVLQTRPGAANRVLSTFHHGLGEVIFEADQIRYPAWARANNLAERQQMRASDLVIAPSHASRARLASLGITTETRVVREPYAFRHGNDNVPNALDEIQYVGRLSIQKGVDKLIYAANVLHSVQPLRRIELIGRVGFTPFRESDIIKYCRSRLRPELADKILYSDFKPREAVLDLIKPGAISPHLGTDETFSYACIEAIDAGQLPMVRHGTAMAEFFPEELANFVLEAQMRSVREMQRQFEELLAHAPDIVRRVREYCMASLDPARVVADLEGTYATALDQKRGWRAYGVRKPRATITDVTVLIPAYKPAREFMETVDSLAAQTAGIPKVLICDDGTPEDHPDWIAYAQGVLPDCEILKQPNAGLLAARNTLIEACGTPLAIFLDTDDLLGPCLLENMLTAWNSSPKLPDAIIPQRRNFGETNELVLRHLLGDHLHILENDYRMTALIRRDILSEIGFDATRRNGEGDDWNFWLEFDGRGYTGLMLPEAGFFYRLRKGSMSWPWSEGQNVGTQTMLRETLNGVIQRAPEKTAALTRALFTASATKA